MNVKVTVYNNEAINKWKKVIEDTPHLISNQREIIHRLQPQIENLQNQISPLNVEIAGLDTVILASSLNSYCSHHGHRRCSCNHVSAGVFLLQMQRNNLVIKKNGLITQKNNLEFQVDNALREISRLEEHKKFLEEQEIPNARKFLDALHSDPYTYVENFVKRIKNKLTEYDKKYPDQDINVQACLYALEEKLNKILVEKNAPTIEDENTYSSYLQSLSIAENKQKINREWQIKYAEVCGFLWDLYHIFEKNNPNKNEIFEKLLISLLKETHIKEKGDLPDLLATRTSCSEHFARLKNLYPNTFIIPEEKIGKDAKNNYGLAFANLQNTLSNTDSHLTSLISELAENIRKEIEQEKKLEKKDKTKKTKYKLYTSLLHTADAVLKNEDHIDELLKFADIVSGKPSYPKIIGGLLLGIAGAVLVAVSVTAVVSTFGISAPLSSVGICFGTTLLAQSAAIVASTVASVAAGIGWTLFGTGLRHGISKNIIDINKEVRNPHPDENREHRTTFAMSS